MTMLKKDILNILYDYDKLQDKTYYRSPKQFIELSKNLISINKVKEAISTLEIAHKRKILSPSLYFTLGYYYSVFDHDQKSLDIWEEAVQKDMANAEIYYFLAYFPITFWNEPQNGIELLEQARSKGIMNAETYELLGYCYYINYSKRKGVKVWEEAMQKDMANAKILAYLGSFYESTGDIVKFYDVRKEAIEQNKYFDIFKPDLLPLFLSSSPDAKMIRRGIKNHHLKRIVSMGYNTSTDIANIFNVNNLYGEIVKLLEKAHDKDNKEYIVYFILINMMKYNIMKDYWHSRTDYMKKLVEKMIKFGDFKKSIKTYKLSKTVIWVFKKFYGIDFPFIIKESFDDPLFEIENSIMLNHIMKSKIVDSDINYRYPYIVKIGENREDDEVFTMIEEEENDKDIVIPQYTYYFETNDSYFCIIEKESGITLTEAIDRSAISTQLYLKYIEILAFIHMLMPKGHLEKYNLKKKIENYVKNSDYDLLLIPLLKKIIKPLSRSKHFAFNKDSHTDNIMYLDNQKLLILDLDNKGFAPTALDLATYLNFIPFFSDIEIRYKIVDYYINHFNMLCAEIKSGKIEKPIFGRYFGFNIGGKNIVHMDTSNIKSDKNISNEPILTHKYKPNLIKIENTVNFKKQYLISVILRGIEKKEYYKRLNRVEHSNRVEETINATIDFIFSTKIFSKKELDIFERIQNIIKKK